MNAGLRPAPSAARARAKRQRNKSQAFPEPVGLDVLRAPAAEEFTAIGSAVEHRPHHTLKGSSLSFDTFTTYQYDALGRRIVEGPTSGLLPGGEPYSRLYYSSEAGSALSGVAGWQVVHEVRESDDGGSSSTIGGEDSPDVVTIEQTLDYVWSLAYIDAMVLRDFDTDGNGTSDQRLYVQQDANFNVTAIIDPDGDVVERFIQDPYGTFTVLNPDWSVDYRRQRL